MIARFREAKLSQQLAWLTIPIERPRKTFRTIRQATNLRRVPLGRLAFAEDEIIGRNAWPEVLMFSRKRTKVLN